MVEARIRQSQIPKLDCQEFVVKTKMRLTGAPCTRVHGWVLHHTTSCGCQAMFNSDDEKARLRNLCTGHESCCTTPGFFHTINSTSTKINRT